MSKSFIFFLLLNFVTSSRIVAQTTDMKRISASNLDIKVVNDPMLDYHKYSSFSVVSANVLFREKSLTLEEKHLEFFLTNAEDIISLKYISLNDSVKPDLMFVYDFSNDYKEKLVPPRTYSFPIWHSGNNTTINTNTNSNFNSTGNLNITGNVIGNGNTTITQNGKWEITKVERPSYTLGQFFPNFSLTIYDTSNNTIVWEGNANGTSKERDFRLPAQYLMWSLFLKIPKGSYSDPNYLTNNNGKFGIGYYIFNTDGTNFYPGIYAAEEGNGFQETNGFKPNDVILSINSQSTENKTKNQIDEYLRGNAGTKFQFVIFRNGKQIKKTIVKTKRK